MGGCVGRGQSKDSCISLPLAGDIASALGLWHQRALKISYGKCRFLAFSSVSENYNCARLATIK